MESFRKVSKQYYLRQIVACFLVWCMLFVIPARVAMADPSPAMDALPSGVIDRTGIDAPTYTSGRMDMTQTAQGAVVNWDNFDIGSSATVEFHQPNMDAAVLNRVHDGSATGIMGALLADGGVYIINPAGVIFGEGASLNVTQLVASSLDIADADFLDGLPYTFTGGGLEGTGDVKNYADIAAEVIALIGKNVFNEGSLDAKDLAIMAAGETILISENGSNVLVEPSMGDSWTPSCNYQVKNQNGGEITAGMDSDEQNAQIVLAAGDVWSSALVHAYSDGGSDAAARVDITAAGDVTVTDKVIAEAEVTDGTSDATAEITVSAGGDVEIFDEDEVDGERSGLYAWAYGNDNTASVDVIADGDVTVRADASPDDAWADTRIEAKAGDGKENSTANVTIDTLGDLDVIAEHGDATILARADAEQNNSATVDVIADGDVTVKADCMTPGRSAGAHIDAEAYDGTSNTAKIEIDTLGDVWVQADGRGYEKTQAGIEAETYVESDTGTNMSSLSIKAGGKVVARADDAGEVDIDAEAENGTTNTATTNITADNYVEVKAVGEDSDADLSAEAEDGSASNTATVDITVTGKQESEDELNGDVAVTAEGYDSDAEIEAFADPDGEEDAINIANVTVNADDDVTVKAENDGEADLDAEAYFGKSNTANMTINAGDDVKVKSYEGGDSDIDAEAWYGKNNTAKTTITAGDDVKVIARYGGNSDIDAEAWYGENNTAKTTITAGDDVKVIARYGGNSDIDAEAKYNAMENNPDMENNADVQIDAGGNVIVMACDDSDAEIQASTGYGMNNTSGVDILANNVLAFAQGGSSTEILAIAGSEETDGPRKLAIQQEPEPDEMPETRNSAGVNIETFTVEVEEETEPLDLLQSEGMEDIIWDVLEDMLEAGGHTAVAAIEGSEAKISAEAYESTDNTANTNINAQGSVLAGAAYGSDATLGAFAEYAHRSNNASLGIRANNVLALGAMDSSTRVKARAARIEFPYTNGVSINGDGFEYEDTSNNASVDIETFAIDLDLPEPPEPDTDMVTLMNGFLDEPTELVETLLEGGHVIAGSLDGGDTQIEAITYGDEYSSTNVSDVLICAEGAVLTAALEDLCGLMPFSSNNENGETNAEIKALSHFGNNNNSSVGIGAQLGLGALSMGYDSDASITSESMYGYTNTAELVACTEGPAGVLGIYGGDAEIATQASYGEENTASTAVCADSLVAVGAIGEGSEAVIDSFAGYEDDLVYSISAEPLLVEPIPQEMEPTTASAETIVVSKESGVAVVAMDWAEAGIASFAEGAYNNDAYTGVCGEDHVIAAAGVDFYDFLNGGNARSAMSVQVVEPGSGGTAYISSNAGGYMVRPTVIQQEPGDDLEPTEPTTSDAETAVVSRKGSVAVVDETGEGFGEAGILSEAYGTELNTAYTGVAAAADLSPGALDSEPTNGQEPADLIEYLEQAYREFLDLGQGNVYVFAEGPYSSARIQSDAQEGYENAADTVVCAPGEVIADAVGTRSLAKIKSNAKYGEVNNSTNQIYASEVDMIIPGLYRGNGIWAYAHGIDDKPHVPYTGDETGYDPEVGDNLEFIMTEYNGDYGTGELIWSEEQVEGDSSAELMVRDYSQRQDCPDCPSCPDCPCEDGDIPPIPPSPLYTEMGEPAEIQEFGIGGCPALLEWLAAETGTSTDELQVSVPGSFASNTDIQPCVACSNLRNTATILADADGTRIASLAAVVNEFVTPGAPITSEQMTLIASAMATPEEGTQYAAAAEWLDALAEYVGIMSTELGFTTEEALAFSGKYTAPIIEGEDTALAAYVGARLAEIAGG